MEFLQNEWTYMILIGLTLLCLILFGEILHRGLEVSGQVTRSMIQLLSGFVCLLFPFSFETVWPMLVVAMMFSIMFHLTRIFDLLPSIHNIGRSSVGAEMFPQSILMCFVIQEETQSYMFFVLPMLVMGVSDASATFAGRKWGKQKFYFFNTYKTYAGSYAFFLVTVVLCVFVFSIYISKNSWFDILMFSTLVASMTTIVEGVSVRGADNVTVPATVIFFLYLLRPYMVL